MLWEKGKEDEEEEKKEKKEKKEKGLCCVVCESAKVNVVVHVDKRAIVLGLSRVSLCNGGNLIIPVQLICISPPNTHIHTHTHTHTHSITQHHTEHHTHSITAQNMATLAKPGMVVPEYIVAPDELKGYLSKLVAGPEYHKLCEIIDHTLVSTRHLVRPASEIFATGSTATASFNNKVYMNAATALFRRAVAAALEAADAEPQDISAIISVSCTGVAMPGVGPRLFAELGFAPTVEHMPVSQWGCAGGVAALKWADMYCKCSPTKSVLVVCYEVCSSMYHGEMDRGSLICASLFGDAAAGVVAMGAQSPLLHKGKGIGMTLSASAEYTIPNSEDWMYYDVDEKGLFLDCL